MATQATLEAREAMVPGTIHLIDVHSSGPDTLVLNPRPSTDPEDPLNWTPFRKQVAIWSVYIYLFGVSIATTVHYSVLSDIATETGITIAELNTGTGLMILFIGWGCLIWQPIALVLGRRGVYVLTSLLGLAPMIWTAYSKTAAEWYAHRILIGFFLAPVESLPEVSTADLFFAHERGNYISIYVLILFGGNALAPMLAGLITNGLGWRAAIWFGTIVLAVTTVIIMFTLEETMYFRQTVEGFDDGIPAQDVQGIIVPASKNDGTSPTMEVEEKNISTPPSPPSPVLGQSYPTPRTYKQKLHLFRDLPGRPSTKQMFVMMYRPLTLIFHFPNIVWAGFLYGTNLSWYAVCNGTMSLILSSSPYNFPPSMVGVAYVSPFIGSVVGALWAGWIGDKIALFLARRNGGMREPEHRLWILTVSGLVGGGGFLLWGIGAAHNMHFMGLIIGIGMVMSCVVVGGSTALAYTIDCFKEISGESVILVQVIRNTMGFGFSYGITPWLESQGLVKTFVAVAALSLFCNLTFLALVFWGKKLRSMSAKKYWELIDSLLFTH